MMPVKKSQKVEIVNAHACGIDIGSRSHFVAIGQGKDDVKEFGVYTEDHFALILSNFFKRICFKKGRKEAIAATARKLAVIIWNMLTRYQSYQPMNTDIVIEKIKKRKIKEIEKMIQKYKITQNEIILNL